MSHLSRFKSALLKYGLLIGTSVATLLFSASPATALGANNQMADGGAFCMNLSTKASNVTSRLTSLKARVVTAWQNQDARLSTLESRVDTKVAADRVAATARRASEFKKLEAKATTDAEKVAVTNYENSVNQAVTARRVAIDAARATFRIAVKNAILARRNTLSDQTDAFIMSAGNALSIAESSCNSNGDTPAAIRHTLQVSLKTARLTFIGDRQSDGKTPAIVRQLAQTRVAAFKAADQTFQSAIKAAAQTLKAAFGDQSSDV